MKRSQKHVAVLLSLLMSPAGLVSGEDVEAFTEPYKQVAVPAPEIGVIANILVREGDQVLEHEALAQLDDRILRATLAVAEAAKNAEGAIKTAEADVVLRANLLDGYRQLHERGNATQRELDRAESQYQQSLARLQSVREDLELKRLEYMRVESQIENRRITAPMSGHVVSVVKEVGEFVSPADAIIMHIAQLKILKAVFVVPLANSGRLHAGQTVSLRVGSDERECKGVIEFVSPIADAESGTVRVEIRIANDNANIQSGIVCRWDQSTAPTPEGVAGRGSHEHGTDLR